MERKLEKVFLTISNVCNNKCLYCFQDGKKNNVNLNFETITSLITMLNKVNIKKLSISGGEPALHPQFIEILKYLECCDFEVNLFTNGILTDDKIAAINNSKISKVYVSLDGSNEKYNITRGVGNFHKIDSTIKRLKKNVVIMNTLNSSNYLNAQEFLLHCSRYENVVKINFNPIKILHNSYSNLALTKEMIQYVNEAVNEFRKNYSLEVRTYYNFYAEKIMNCSAGISSVAIDYNGDISGCIFGSSLDAPELIAGNIKEKEFEEIWNDESRWDIFTKINSDKCNNCNCQYEKCTGLCKIEMKLNSINKVEEFLCVQAI